MQQSSKKRGHKFVSEIYTVITFVTIIYTHTHIHTYIYIYIYEHILKIRVLPHVSSPHDTNIKYHEHESEETPATLEPGSQQ